MVQRLNLQSLVLFLMAVLVCSGAEYAHAQCSSTVTDVTPTTASSGTTQVNTSWNWQVDQAGTTTTLMSQAGFNRPSTTTPCELLQINIPVSGTKTVHEVHGQISFAVWTGGTCMNGSVIGQVRDQNLNVIATFKIQQFGPSTVTVPVVGTFPTPLSVNQLQIQYFADECGTLTWSWSLVMS
ncbi:MAG TPA: hypothetical protein VGJ51_05535 [Candidatus Angelobacter sp.]